VNVKLNQVDTWQVQYVMQFVPHSLKIPNRNIKM